MTHCQDHMSTENIGLYGQEYPIVEINAHRRMGFPSMDTEAKFGLGTKLMLYNSHQMETSHVVCTCLRLVFAARLITITMET